MSDASLLAEIRALRAEVLSMAEVMRSVLIATKSTSQLLRVAQTESSVLPLLRGEVRPILDSLPPAPGLAAPGGPAVLPGVPK